MTSGQAFAIAGSDKLLSNRFDGSAWGTAAKRRWLSEISDSARIADDGTAMTVWRDDVGNESRVFAQSLSPEDKWSAVETLQSGARIVSIKRFGSGFLAVYVSDSEHACLLQFVQSQAGVVYEQRSLTPVANSLDQGIATSDTAALLVGGHEQHGDGGALQWDVVDQRRPSHQHRRNAAQPSATEGTSRRGFTQNTALRFALRPQGRLGGSGQVGSHHHRAIAGLGIEIDAAGKCARCLAQRKQRDLEALAHSSVGWADPQQIEDQDPIEVVYSAGNPSSGEVVLVWANPLGVWATRFE